MPADRWRMHYIWCSQESRVKLWYFMAKNAILLQKEAGKVR